ncbi:MAG: hypothetical protein WCL34_06780 [Methylococcaceae bacterium]
MSIKCPTCQQAVLRVFKCDFCGEIRCDATFSNAGKGACGTQYSPSGKAQAAVVGHKCYQCGKGKYLKM